MVRRAREYDTDEKVRVKLTLGAPGVSPDLFFRWLGVRFVAWLDGGDDDSPTEIPPPWTEFRSRPRMGVASSRIGRALDKRPDWFAALRTACAEAGRQSWSLLAVTGTTTGPFMADAARRSGLPCFQVDVADDRQSFTEWLGEALALSLPSSPCPTPRQTEPSKRVAAAARLRLSPPIRSFEQWQRALSSLEDAGLDRQRAEVAAQLDFSSTMLGDAGRSWFEPSDLGPTSAEVTAHIDAGLIAETIAGTPARDRALCVLADELRLLEVRRRGNWAKLVDARRSESLFSTESMSEVVDRAGPTLESAASESASDAANFAVHVPAPLVGQALVGQALAEEALAEPRIVELSALERFELLIHCTRRQDRPWPGQAWSDYFDELWDDLPAKDRSASAALRNILRTGRIFASGAAIRGATPVVCFTSAKPHELAALRRFRRHRQRWDFEPYGLAVSREWLGGRGARPVVYGDESAWNRLSDSERPFFQPTNGRAAVDWTVENEWRLIGDLLLDELPADAAYVLVATRRDAERLAALSRWPIVILTDPGQDATASIAPTAWSAG